jgi:putative transposase
LAKKVREEGVGQTMESCMSLGIRVSLNIICKELGLSRQAYYMKKRRDAKRAKESADILDMVKGIRQEQFNVGTKKLHKMLRNTGICFGRDRLHKLLKEDDLLVKRKKKYIRTTNSKHWMRKYPNLIKGIDLSYANQVYVSDITYIRHHDGFSYLFLISDLYSRKIVGWSLSRDLRAKHAVKALRMALRREKPAKKLIHHSDRGIQYCSKEHVNLLKKYKIGISMTEDLHVYENAVAERVNSTLKNEFELEGRFKTHQELEKGVNEVITVYNTKRLHMSINYMTPSSKHAA